MSASRHLAARGFALAAAVAIPAGGAALLADVADVPGPVFVAATAVGMTLALAAVVAGSQGRVPAVPDVALVFVSVIGLGGTAAVIDFTGASDVEWLWIGLGSACAAVAIWIVERAWRVPPYEPTPKEAPLSPEPPKEINAETVEVGLENVRWVLADEQARGQSLQTRASGLAGFGGIIISLLAATVGTVARRQDLMGGQRTAVIVFLVYGLLLLIAAVAMLLLGVLATRNIEVTAVRELKLYKTRRFMTHSPAWARGRITSTLVETLEAERATNDKRVLWLNAGAAGVVAALVFVAGAALTLLL